MLSQSYLDAHRYDGAVVHHDRREAVVPCVLQPRDIAIVRDVWRYKFLTASQLLELWWPDGIAWPGQRRLRKLFNAGYLERFRPLARRGSYPWTYHLGEAGHQLLRNAGLIPAKQRYHRRAIYDYGHVLHELQLNAWVLALRRAPGGALLGWDGELDIVPPPGTRAQSHFDGDWSAEDLRDPRPKLIRPDAVLEVAPRDTDTSRTIFVEFDRTNRLDKNYDKFRRYDAFLCWWWRETDYAAQPTPPFVVFVCQSAEQREQFVAAADGELTGHRWHPGVQPGDHDYVGRRRILFALEHDAHNGLLEAWQLPPFPAGHPERETVVRPVPLVPRRPDPGSGRDSSPRPEFASVAKIGSPEAARSDAGELLKMHERPKPSEPNANMCSY